MYCQQIEGSKPSLLLRGYTWIAVSNSELPSETEINEISETRKFREGLHRWLRDWTISLLWEKAEIAVTVHCREDRDLINPALLSGDQQQDQKQRVQNETRRFHLNMKKHFFTVRVTEHRLCRDVVSVLGDIQKTSGHGPGKLALCSI